MKSTATIDRASQGTERRHGPASIFAKFTKRTNSGNVNAINAKAVGGRERLSGGAPLCGHFREANPPRLARAACPHHHLGIIATSRATMALFGSVSGSSTVK
jgi:hypothetical protein